MRKVLATICITLAIGGCSKAPDAEGSAPFASGNHNSVETLTDAGDTSGAPGVAVTAAPGVAFTYHYGFRLPPRAIAATQEAHAQACEKLGIARCRITGMDYRVVGENDIRGRLLFKLDPTIARAFGKRGIDLVAAAKGSLADATITGTDAAEAITRANAAAREAAAAERDADQRLGASGQSPEERAELQSRRIAAANAVQAAAAQAEEARASLATTPMEFVYESGDTVRGFDTSAPLTSALDTMVVSAQVTLAVLLGLIAIFGPPAIVIVVGLLLWRRMRDPVARWRGGDGES